MPFYVINESFVFDTNGNIGIGTAYPRGALDLASTASGLVVPVEPLENESGGGSGGASISVNTPAVRISRALGRFERRVQTAWKSSVLWYPVILSATPTKLQNVGMQTVVSGSNLEPSATWSFVGANGQEYPCISQWTNAQTVTLTRPLEFPVSNEPYRLKVYNTESKTQFVTSTLFFDAGEGPTFVTASGSLSNLSTSTYYNPGLVIEAIDEVGGGMSNIAINGDLSSSGLNAVFEGSNLLIQGTTATVENATTFNFTATATDLGGNTATRAFSFTIQPPYIFLLMNGTFASTTHWTPSIAWNNNSSGPWIQDNTLFFGWGSASVTQIINIKDIQGLQLNFSYEYYADWFNASANDTYKAYVEVYDSANTLVHTFGQSTTFTITTTGSTTWYPVTFSTTTAANNINRIVVTIQGNDAGGWSGAWYGPRFRNVSLRTSSGATYLYEYPPAALTNGVYSTTISGAAYGNGAYVISQSANGWSDYKVWKLFNYTYGNFGDFWHTNDTFDASTQYYTGSEYIVSGYNGEWVKIQMPVSITLAKYRIWPRTDVSNRDPRDWRLYGSSDGTNWTLLDTRTNVSGWTQTVSYMNFKEFSVSVVASCSYFALVVNRSYNTAMQISELRFYGV